MSAVGNAVASGLGGALVGALTGYLIDGKKGAGYGAAAGGIGMALVAGLASSGSTATGTGKPLEPHVKPGQNFIGKV
jgi:hypothetical protein